MTAATDPGRVVAWLYEYAHDGESDQCLSPVPFLDTWVECKSATVTPLVNESLLAEAERERDNLRRMYVTLEQQYQALQAQVDAVRELADRWEVRALEVDSYVDSAEDRMVSVCLNGAATEIRTAIGDDR